MSASKGERNSFVTDWSVLDQGSAIFGPQPKISLPSVGMAHMLTIALTFLNCLKVNTIGFTFFKGEKNQKKNNVLWHMEITWNLNISIIHKWGFIGTYSRLITSMVSAAFAYSSGRGQWMHKDQKVQKAKNIY